jgi:nucleoside-diphosphate kinase
MASLSEERYSFNIDWYDDQAAIIRKFILNYFVVTNMIEMFDVKNSRIFLKKIEVPGVKLEDFFVGAQVTILARVLKVTDYADVRTRNAFEQHRAKTFAMIKPHAYSNIGKIID